MNKKVVTIFVINCAIAAAQWNPIQNSCAGRLDGYVFPDQNFCDSFVQCQSGATVRQRCPEGRLFDMNLYYCVASHAVDCGTRAKPPNHNNSVHIPKQPEAPVAPPSSWWPENPPSSESHHSVCRNVRNGATIANPTSCRAYIECQQNLRLDRECGKGELFETRSGACLNDFMVDCGGRPIYISNQDVIVTRNMCVGQRNGMRIANPTDCRGYFECRSQQAFEQTCPPKSLFEINIGMCIYEGAVRCNARGNSNGNQIVPQQPDISNGIAATICFNMPQGTRISNPQDCRLYHECRNNQRIDLSCPAGQSYDMGSNQCRPSNVVNCGSRRSLNNLNNACQDQRNGRLIGNPLNCRAFFECQNDDQIERTCENGNLFDTQFERCLPAHTVRCGSRVLPPSGVEPQTPEDFFPACPRNGIVFRPHPHDCQGYFICAEGNLIQHFCAPGVYFNPDTFQCDFPQNVQCRLTRIVVPQTSLLPDCSSGASFYPNLVNCKQFYACVDKEPKLMDCPAGQVWNNLKLKCEQSDLEICARRFRSNGVVEYSKPSKEEMNL